jgi:hypothetical protein
MASLRASLCALCLALAACDGGSGQAAADAAAIDAPVDVPAADAARAETGGGRDAGADVSGDLPPLPPAALRLVLPGTQRQPATHTVQSSPADDELNRLLDRVARHFIHEATNSGFTLGGMTAEEAAQFTSTVDWTSTLLVPIPKNAASYQQVMVDGVTGTLIERPSDDAPQFALFWVKDGIIYTIGGLGSNAQKAIEIANSLP